MKVISCFCLWQELTFPHGGGGRRKILPRFFLKAIGMYFSQRCCGCVGLQSTGHVTRKKYVIFSPRQWRLRFRTCHLSHSGHPVCNVRDLFGITLTRGPLCHNEMRDFWFFDVSPPAFGVPRTFSSLGSVSSMPTFCDYFLYYHYFIMFLLLGARV